MFGIYNINDLYLAVIEITYPSVGFDSKSGLLRSQIVNYEHFTILLRKNQGYIDLQKNNVIKHPMASYRIKSLEPLSAYYTSDGRKRHINKKEAIETSKVYYKSIYKKS